MDLFFLSMLMLHHLFNAPYSGFCSVIVHIVLASNHCCCTLFNICAFITLMRENNLDEVPTASMDHSPFKDI
jgi:hypothetical protein